MFFSVSVCSDSVQILVLSHEVWWQLTFISKEVWWLWKLNIEIRKIFFIQIKIFGLFYSFLRWGLSRLPLVFFISNSSNFPHLRKSVHLYVIAPTLGVKLFFSFSTHLFECLWLLSRIEFDAAKVQLLKFLYLRRRIKVVWTRILLSRYF